MPPSELPSERPLNRRTFLRYFAYSGAATVGAGAVGAAGIGIYEGFIEEPKEWEVIPEQQVVTQEIQSKQRRVRATFEHVLEEVGTERYLLLDDGYHFMVEDAAGNRREFRLHTLEETQGKKTQGTYNTESAFAHLLNIECGEEDVRFFGLCGVISVKRSEIRRIFEVLRDSSRFAQPLMVGNVPAKLEAEVCGKDVREDTCSMKLFFEEKPAPVPDGVIAMADDKTR